MDVCFFLLLNSISRPLFLIKTGKNIFSHVVTIPAFKDSAEREVGPNEASCLEDGEHLLIAIGTGKPNTDGRGSKRSQQEGIDEQKPVRSNVKIFFPLFSNINCIGW